MKFYLISSVRTYLRYGTNKLLENVTVAPVYLRRSSYACGITRYFSGPRIIYFTSRQINSVFVIKLNSEVIAIKRNECYPRDYGNQLFGFNFPLFVSVYVYAIKNGHSCNLSFYGETLNVRMCISHQLRSLNSEPKTKQFLLLPIIYFYTYYIIFYIIHIYYLFYTGH